MQVLRFGSVIAKSSSQCFFCIESHPHSMYIKDGSVSKMSWSGGRQRKPVPILGLHQLVQPNQAWIFPLNDMAIKVHKCTKYEIQVYNFFRFLSNILSFPCIFVLRNEYCIKSANAWKLGIKAYNFFRFYVFFEYFNASFHCMCWQEKWQL